MKFKLKKFRFSNEILILIILVASVLTFTSSFYIEKLAGNTIYQDHKTLSVKNSKSIKIKEYVNTHNESLVDEVDINGEVTSILLAEDDKYKVKLFDYETGEELEIDSLIKANEKENFDLKIKKLLYLKYPKFIADVLILENTEKSFFLKENELVIYYYNYEIDPMPKEQLYLRINYNEVKDYLDITVKLDSKYQNEDGSRVDSTKKLIAITFDDGPGPYTSRLIDILNDNKAKSTFFMLGKNLENYRNTVLKAHNSGMEIAYHSYAHQNFKRQELEEVVDDLNYSNEVLKSITGDIFHLIRPPYGSINDEIKDTLDNVFILWDIDTNDWQKKNKDVEYLTNYTLESVSDGDIILFHDIHQTSVDAIENLLPLLYVNGYQVVTVSDLAKNAGKTLETHHIYRSFKR